HPPDPASSGTVCRAAAGACDVAESCTGTSAACPPDTKSTAVCRAAAGSCDLAESCDGLSADCPADTFKPATVECRPAAGVCDVAESCDGTSAACPADGKSTVVCRAAAGVCDTAESCDGVHDDCPADAVQPAGRVCRPAAGVCDLAEADSDHDGIGDACDPCTNIVPVFATRARIKIRKLNVPGSNVLRMKGKMAVPTAPPIDPAAKGVRVLLTDAQGGSMLDAIIPGGAGWTSNRAGTAWRNHNPGE